MSAKAGHHEATWGSEAGSWALLVHGGAGDLPDSEVERHVSGCREAARAAAQVLRAGGTALDAVERAVVILEDDPVFNAATGACLNADGRLELDAALMDGKTLRAGGVCALPAFPHPIAVARAVLAEGRHVLYAGAGAERFALEQGFSRAKDEAMITPFARERWEAARAREGQAANEGGASSLGTVGAVARDRSGSVACATSTGGRLNKRPGRVGDSPIPGAGTYADDDGGACSATGDGEAILRVCLAKGAVDLLRERIAPEEVARAVIRRLHDRAAGGGGVILVDRFGRLGLARNTPTMTWAAAGEVFAEVVAGS